MFRSVTAMFIESKRSKVAQVMQMNMDNPFELNGMKTKAFHQFITCNIHKPSNKIALLCARHKLREPLIYSCIVMQNNCNTPIWFVSDL